LLFVVYNVSNYPIKNKSILKTILRKTKQ